MGTLNHDLLFLELETFFKITQSSSVLFTSLMILELLKLFIKLKLGVDDDHDRKNDVK